MVDEFVHGTDWEVSSGPYVNRQLDIGDIWPVGLASEVGGGNKDILADGLHPVVAIGPQDAAGNRSVGQQTGVVVSYYNDHLIVVNVARGFVVKAYVHNVLTYQGGNPATFEQAPEIGQPVYVDDSAPLTAGVTLSLSPLNSAGTVNPLAGFLWYDQDEYLDIGVGGANAAALWPKVWANAATETLVQILLK